MKNILEYKGYYSKVEYNSEDRMLHGKIEGISDLVTFESSDATMIEKEFESAVDDYLDFCLEVGKEPDKVYKGTFNIRISPELHKEISEYGTKNNISLNSAVETAISSFLKSIKHNDDACSEYSLANLYYHKFESILERATEPLWESNSTLNRMTRFSLSTDIKKEALNGKYKSIFSTK